MRWRAWWRTSGEERFNLRSLARSASEGRFVPPQFPSLARRACLYAEVLRSTDCRSTPWTTSNKKPKIIAGNTIDAPRITAK